MNILTIDFEEWFHILNFDYSKYKKYKRIEQNTEYLLDILKQTYTKATFFILASLAEQYKEIVTQISKDFDIGIHGYNHLPLYTMSSKEIKEDILRAKDTIEHITNKNVNKYRAPGFSIPSKETFNILAQCKIKIDSSATCINHFYGKKILKNDTPTIINTRYGIIKEMPPSSFDFFLIKGFLGGGYFRLLPYGIIKNIIKRKQNYSLCYLHPRDFDIGQPRLKELTLFSKFKASVGLQTAKSKLQKCLREFDFTDISTAEQNIDWQKIEKITL